MVEKTNTELIEGEIFLGIISNVIDSKSFYVAPIEQLEQLNEATKILKMDELEEIFWIPGVGDNFLINIPNEGLLRAKRIANNNEKSINIYLLDTGEKVQCIVEDLFKGKMFVMPSYLQNIEPVAIPCVRNAAINEDHIEIELYGKFTFEVAKKRTDGLVIVNMWTYNEGVEDKTAEEMREILNKEEPTNYNAQIAAQGFHTKDDEKRCQFYNPMTGGCWKGGRCKLQHLPETDDGTFRDTRDIYFYDTNAPELPKQNMSYAIKIISFINLNRFTCHYCDSNLYYGKSLEELRRIINSGTYKHLQFLPAIGELVTVEIGKRFHRARVMEEIGEFMNFPVFLVDEGIYNVIVNYEQIYEYCSNTSDYPFFAIEMVIADIQPIPNIQRVAEAQKFILKKEQRFGPLKALIVDNKMDIECKLYYANSCEIGKALVEKGLVEAKEAKSLPNEKLFIPG